MYRRHRPGGLQGPVSQARAEPGAPLPATPSTRRATDMDHSSRQPRPRDPQIRHELVERVRREIAEGTYDTPEKMDIALERLLERLEEK